MADAHASETLALRVLERWCLVGDEPMEGEQWEMMCELAGVNPQTFALLVSGLLLRTTADERQARARELSRFRGTRQINGDAAA